MTDIQTFEKLFKGNTILFDWRRAHQENWKVSVEAIDNISDLGELWVPWQRDKDDIRVGAGMFEERGRSFQLKELMNTWPNFTHHDAVLENAVKFRKTGAIKPLVFAFPSVQWKNKILLLDGCRRASGLMLANTNFKIALFKVNVGSKFSFVWEIIDS